MKLSKKDKAGVPVDVVELIEDTIEVATLLGPALSKAISVIDSFVQSLGSKNPNSPKNVRLRLAAVEKLSQLQSAKLLEIESRLQEQEEIEILPENTNSTTPVHEAAGKVLYYNSTTRERQALKPSDKAGIAKLKGEGFKRIGLAFWNTLTKAAPAA